MFFQTVHNFPSNSITLDRAEHQNSNAAHIFKVYHGQYFQQKLPAPAGLSGLDFN